MLNDRRLGRWFLRSRMIQGHPLKCLELMKDTLILECSYRHDRDSYEYVGINANFKETPRGHYCPTYNVEVDFVKENFDSLIDTLSFNFEHPEWINH